MDALGWSVGARPLSPDDLRWAARPTLDALHRLGALVNRHRADSCGREDVVGPHGQVLARLALQVSP